MEMDEMDAQAAEAKKVEFVGADVAPRSKRAMATTKTNEASKRSSPVAAKDRRIQMRIDDETRSLLEQAAALNKSTLSAFVLSAARVRAEEMLSERNHLALSQEAWNNLMDAMDEPAAHLPALAAFMKRKAPWDK
jgi:uncharacterized protein (DUF1778 family)